MREPLTFKGCAPTPLVSYLKALGILRLISSDANHASGRAADSKARGWWENERFRLSTALDRGSLSQFFLNQYAPSPIIAPWNGRAGFLEGEDSSRTGAELMSAIQQSEIPRLENMRRTVKSLRNNKTLRGYNESRAKGKELEQTLKVLKGDEKHQAKEKLKQAEKQSKKLKSLLLPMLRATTDADHLIYIDACYILATDEAAAPLLGSGGNDGSREFGMNFAKCLKDLFKFENGIPKDGAAEQLESALFSVNQHLPVSGSMGQFSPGQGGANATTGYKGMNPLNPWDVVLAMEGTMVFVGALTRQWSDMGHSRAAFPFTFDPVAAGAGSLSSADPNRPSGEIWAPLWHKPATFSEIAAIFAEGRLTLGRRTARTGLDAARSVARIGQSRGISGFERYSLIKPSSEEPHQATRLGRFNTPDRPRKDLIEDLETGGWLERVRRFVAGDKSTSAHARSAMRRLNDALFQMTGANQVANGTGNALMALGGFVCWVTASPKVREELKPPPLLSSAWIREADDGSPEFRIAAALAGIGLPPPKAGGKELPNVSNASTGTAKAPPMAEHFAPIKEGSFLYGQNLRQHRSWDKDNETKPNVVWGAGSLVSNMIAVLERRLVEAGIRGLDDKPLAGATYARLIDVAAFLSDNFDDARCAALLAGLIWARPTRLGNVRPTGNTRPVVPFAYAALKPVFTPDRSLHRIGALAEITRLPIPPGLVTRLRAGGGSLDGSATNAAVHIALARCRGSGIPSPFDPAQAGGRTRTGKGCQMGVGVPADRLAAALLIPVGDKGLKSLIERVYPGAVSIHAHKTNSTEVTTDAA